MGFDCWISPVLRSAVLLFGCTALLKICCFLKPHFKVSSIGECTGVYPASVKHLGKSVSYTRSSRSILVGPGHPAPYGGQMSLIFRARSKNISTVSLRSFISFFLFFHSSSKVHFLLKKLTVHGDKAQGGDLRRGGFVNFTDADKVKGEIVWRDRFARESA